MDPCDELLCDGSEHFERENAAQTSAFDMEAWEMRGRELAKRYGEVRWELGDWLNEGEPYCPDIRPGEIPGAPACNVYTCAEATTGLARGTLKDLASTARRCPQSVRTDALSWSHHRALVNALPNADDEQLKEWLSRAVNDGMSVRQLKEALRPPSRGPINSKSFRVTVPLGVWETLKDAADHAQSTVQRIAAQWLVDKAQSDDVQTQRKFQRQQTRQRRRERRRQVGLRVAMSYDPLGLQR